jgi:hypothetical protein
MTTRKRFVRALTLLAAVTLLASCATSSFRPGVACAATGFSVTDNFEGARRGECRVVSDEHVAIEIRPESDGYINNSPWYAFKVEPAGADMAHVTLRYVGGHHRYWPKMSGDGLNWYPMDERFVSPADDRLAAHIIVPLDGRTVWVAAHELITPAIYDAWGQMIAGSTGFSPEVLGYSKSGLPIHVFDTNEDGRELLLLVGRQHPPEVSGAFAFFAFAETILGSSDLATRFRERFRVAAIPLLNPDGVVSGNWRHNLDHTDLNRDWGLFKQPETVLIRDMLERFDTEGSKIRMFIDFHSTRENTFYTQHDETRPPGFTARWLAKAATRIEDYPFDIGNAPSKSPYVAKNYMYSRYGIPAITFEAGDETDRQAVRDAARIFAEELMQQMLDQAY